MLEHLQAHVPDTPVLYWRDKAGHEIDFVLNRGRALIDVIECKWVPAAFDATALRVFRGYYPKGKNYLVSPSGDPAYNRTFGTLDVRVCTPGELRKSEPARFSSKTSTS